MAAALELPLQLAVVVDLAVLDDHSRAVLARDRLVPVGEVDDREPPGRQRHRPLVEEAVDVGAAVDEETAHPRHHIEVGGGGPLAGYEAAN